MGFKNLKEKKGENKIQLNAKLTKSRRDCSKQNGITLIALVVTIVVLLILAGVSINAVFGGNGLIQRARDAQRRMDSAKNIDLNAINDLTNLIESQEGTSTSEQNISRNGIIPTGAKYTKADGTVLEGNGINTFPTTLTYDDKYEEGDYIYKYYCF